MYMVQYANYKVSKGPHLHESDTFFLCTWRCSSATCFTNILYL